MLSNEETLKRLQEKRKKAAEARERKLLEQKEDKKIKPVEEKSLVVDHTKEIQQEPNVRLRPIVKKIKSDENKPATDFSTKPIYLTQESLELLIQKIVNGLSEKFVSKKELPSLVHKILQESIIDTKKRGNKK